MSTFKPFYNTDDVFGFIPETPFERRVPLHIDAKEAAAFVGIKPQNLSQQPQLKDTVAIRELLSTTHIRPFHWEDGAGNLPCARNAYGAFTARTTEYDDPRKHRLDAFTQLLITTGELWGFDYDVFDKKIDEETKDVVIQAHPNHIEWLYLRHVPTYIDYYDTWFDYVGPFTITAGFINVKYYQLMKPNSWVGGKHLGECFDDTVICTVDDVSPNQVKSILAQFAAHWWRKFGQSQYPSNRRQELYE